MLDNNYPSVTCDPDFDTYSVKTESAGSALFTIFDLNGPAPDCLRITSFDYGVSGEFIGKHIGDYTYRVELPPGFFADEAV